MKGCHHCKHLQVDMLRGTRYTDDYVEFECKKKHFYDTCGYLDEGDIERLFSHGDNCKDFEASK